MLKNPNRSFCWTVLVPCIFVLAGCDTPEQRAQGYYEKAMAFIAKHDDLNARPQLHTSLKFNSEKIETWRALAGVDERTHLAQGLFLDLRRIVELDPTDDDAKLRLAQMMLGGGAADAALKLTDSIRDNEKNGASVHKLRALIFVSLKDGSNAVREAQKAIEIEPGNPDSVVVLASERLSRGDIDGALQILNTVSSSGKDDRRVGLLKFQVLSRKGDLPQAEAELRRLMDLTPQEAALRTKLVQLEIAQRNFDGAEKDLRAIADAKPDDSGAGLDVVRFLNIVRGPAAAREELAVRIKGKGDVFAYQMALANLDLVQGNDTDAVRALQSLAGSASSADHALAAQTRLAEIFVAQGNVPAAEDAISKVLRKDGLNTDALRLRASIRIDQGKFDEAIADLRTGLNDQPKSPNLLSLMALAYERKGQMELADRQYADALKASGDPVVGLRYVAFLQRRGNLAHADDVLGELSKANPRNIEVWAAVAQSRLAHQNWTGALEVADTISRIGNDRGIAEQIRGTAFGGQNKLDQSIAAFERAHAAAPESLQPVTNLVATYLRAKKTKEAEALLQDLLKKNPQSAPLLLLMGQIQLAKNAPTDAETSFKAAIAQQPKNNAGYDALASLYIGRQKYDEAAHVIEAGLRERPDNLNLKLALAGVDDLRGDHEAGITQYESILKAQPNSIVAINNLASLLIDYRTDKASRDRAYLLVAALKDTKVPQFQDTLGWAAYQQGDYTNAVALLEQASAQLPKVSSVRYHLGMSYRAVGQPAKASEQLKAANDLEPAATALKQKIQAAMK
jgi:tetratricopeptide (TPR) repeat protein